MEDDIAEVLVVLWISFLGLPRNGVTSSVLHMVLYEPCSVTSRFIRQIVWFWSKVGFHCVLEE